MAKTAATFSFLVCPDSRLLQLRLEELHRDASGERVTCWGDEEPPPRFWEGLSSQNLFGASCVLTARHAEQWSAAVWKRISGALNRISPTCRAFFCLEVAWERGRPKIPAHLSRLPCMDFAEKQGWIWRSEGLTEKTLPAHVRMRAKSMGLAFEPDALEAFCSSVPPDASAADNELAKLDLLLGPAGDGGMRTIAAGHLGGSSWMPESNVFSCIRHMQAGDLVAVRRELARARDDVEALLFPLMSLLARELRMLWQSLHGEDAAFRPADAAFKRDLAMRLGPSGLAGGMGLVMDAELGVKSGSVTTEQALDQLTTGMTLLCARARR